MSLTLVAPGAGGDPFPLVTRLPVPVAGQGTRPTATVLRRARLVVTTLLLLAGGLAAAAALAQDAALAAVNSRIDPLTAQVATLHRSLAAADATAIGELIGGGPGARAMGEQVDGELAAAAEALAGAGRLAADDATTDGLTTVGTQLPRYAALIELARSNYRSELPVGASYLRAASDLMQTSMLPTTEALLQRQARLLDDEYAKPVARFTAVAALVVAAAAVLALLRVQVFLARRFRRRLNAGLLVATVVTAAGLAWSGLAWTVAGGHLDRSHEHSRAVSGALVPARIAALQARAAEGLALLTLDGTSREQQYQDRYLRLIRDDGHGGELGGALGAGRLLVTDPAARHALQQAIDAAPAYHAAHAAVGRANAAGDARETVRLAFAADDPSSSAAAFARLDGALAQAVAAERGSFAAQTQGAAAWRGGLAVIAAVLALIAAGATRLGLTPRIEEYR